RAVRPVARRETLTHAGVWSKPPIRAIIEFTRSPLRGHPAKSIPPDAREVGSEASRSTPRASESSHEMEYLIEVEAAAAEPRVLRFKTGREVGPFHVGGKGKWQISAGGVADKHAYLYFNGQQLFLQSVSTDTPVLADGRPLPCEWVPIAAPCEIAIGE